MRGVARQQGYTLLEITVAFAILVVTMSALFESFSMSDTRAVKTANLERATSVAQSIRARAGKDLLLTQPQSGIVENDCRWSLQAEPLPRSGLKTEPTLVAYRTLVQVACGTGQDAAHADLTSLELAKPPS
jgi:general secretion pathway protein I